LSYKKEMDSSVTYQMDVSEGKFKYFLSNHINDFDIPDNKNAQVPSVAFIKIDKDGRHKN